VETASIIAITRASSDESRLESESAELPRLGGLER